MEEILTRIDRSFLQSWATTFSDIQWGFGYFQRTGRFFVKIYGGKHGPINDLRRTMFCEKIQNVEYIPPTQNALLQHCLRAVYQGSIWITAHDPKMEEPDPCLYGWKKSSDGVYNPVWMTISEVSHLCRELVKCNCHKACSLMCSCVKAHLKCADLCKCTCS